MGARIEGYTTGLSVHPERSIVAAVQQISEANGMGRLTVLDVESGEMIIERELAYKPWCVAYSSDGKTLAIGCNDGHVVLFEGEHHTQRLVWRAHDNYIYSIAWTPDGTRLVTASGDESVRIWDTRTRVASRLERDRWIELRAELAGMSDLAKRLDAMVGETREAARIECIRRVRRVR